MLKNFSLPRRRSQLTRAQKVSLAGVATLGAAALALSTVPGGHDGGARPAEAAAEAAPVAWTTSTGTQQIKDVHTSVTSQLAGADQQAKAAAAKLKAQQEAAAAAKKAAAQKAAAQRAAAAKAAEQKAAAAKAKAAADAKAKAEKERAVKAAASRSAARTPVYADNLDGWIRHALAIMQERHIPGSYDGLYRNIIRESSGNPLAINLWDINARNGIPSKGLLQVIPPTFATYHVPGTSTDIYDPVANITAAANYAADRYGSIDNVNSAY